jgi:hypothetical protein
MWMGILTLLVLVVPVATAQDRLDAVAAALDRATATPQTEAAEVDRMAKFLGNRTGRAPRRARLDEARLG